MHSQCPHSFNQYCYHTLTNILYNKFNQCLLVHDQTHAVYTFSQQPKEFYTIKQILHLLPNEQPSIHPAYSVCCNYWAKKNHVPFQNHLVRAGTSFVRRTGNCMNMGLKKTCFTRREMCINPAMVEAPIKSITLQWVYRTRGKKCEYSLDMCLLKVKEGYIWWHYTCTVSEIENPAEPQKKERGKYTEKTWRLMPTLS